MTSVVFADAFAAPVLTRAEERALAERYRRGDQRAKDILVERNIRLAAKVARQYAGRGVSDEDLLQDALEGVIRAVELFDPARGYKFSTYATRWIAQACQRAIERSGHAIRPSHGAPEYRRAFEEVRPLCDSDEEAARRVVAGYPDSKNSPTAARVLYAATGPVVTSSTDAPFPERFVRDRAAERPEDLPGIFWHEGCGRDGARQLVEDAMYRVLTGEQRTILRLRFGWDDRPRASLAECARTVSANHRASDREVDRVHGLELTALDALREALGATLGPDGELRAA